MEITTRTIGNCKVLDCRGPITIGSATETLRQAVREAIQDSTSKVILNLRKMRKVDACGLGELINSYIHVKNQGAKLVFLNLSRNIKRLLTLTKLLPLFEIYDDEQKALDGCE
jgi:anti-sigma B factor antagonist